MAPETARRIGDAQRATKQAADGYARPVPLADRSVALVGDSQVVVIQPGDPWHARVRAALATGRFKVGPDYIAPVVVSAAAPSLPPQSASLEEILAYTSPDAEPPRARGPPVFFEQQLAAQLPALLIEEGQLPPEGIGVGRQVNIVQITDRNLVLDGAGRAMVVRWDGSEWVAAEYQSPSLARYTVTAGTGLGGSGAGGGGGSGGAGGTSPGSTITLVYLPIDCGEHPESLRCQEK